MLKVFEQEPTESISIGYQYLLSVPSDYDENNKDKKWPLLLFLHGAGESHPPIEKILKHGPPKLVHAYSMNKSIINTSSDPHCHLEVEQFVAENFITCSPQVNSGYGWNNQLLINLLDQVTEKYHVDENKIYCTGISMGGYGTWSLAIARPNRFAAIIPICGGGDVQKVTCLKHLPIWNFHGELDAVIPIEQSLRLIRALNSSLCKSTMYPHLEHDSWTETYNNKDVFIWLLQQTKPIIHD